MELWRVQSHDVFKEGFSVDSSGIGGKGIYAMLAGDTTLKRYYLRDIKGAKCYSFDVPINKVKEVKGLGLGTFQAIRERIQHYLETTEYRVFIFKHGGINVPKGKYSKQAVIFDHTIINNIKEITS